MTPTSRVSDSREAFEAWAVERHESIGRFDSDPSQYADVHVQFMWRGWQAALSTMGDVVAVGELPKPIVIEHEHDCTDYADGWNHCLSAILNRGGK